MKKNREHQYEIELPIKETWVFQVSAKNKKDALKKLKNGHEDVEQVCSTGGWPKGIQKPRVTRLS